ncbi:(2-aminoethyl)phosphonate--pyruvate transaminase [Roseomonas mucosa]|uniref:2-aminoethylphosphonate--pyruvate transaminase n=1 Tax=Roseomonas mucosa TaxID=207340 RepID=A0A1S8D2T9_9PROT|nr:MULTISPECIES: 2-aminoethylphosphonate--pyruvate transaminase [Roseomonas]MBS5904743.1 2-aminoethylphosphonate--pyruvate transaminase [Acetobacteraceae bacterium]MCG7353428.1 2-aminoethylphosphonate--pyruvate transaminase [Roseomonas mucosa]MCG7355950.1 2-aminoethylphosphonate--pyruvate transaminase [Roseomonas mucosa]MDT8291486.1 2-aminoethylphosphonate--pyruvate transaminase [Roseomonas mucosa]MDT8292842.1 2-aminoethylphosphonate--pyruvate transaminase [Roseomonas mucosa]
MAPEPILLTPGPLTTQLRTRQAMLRDWGSRDPGFIALTAELRQRLLDVAKGQGSHAAVPLQGSGTFIVEAAIATLIAPGDKLLVLCNGAYGERMVTIARRMGRQVEALSWPEDRVVEPARVAEALRGDPAVTHVALVHCETTTGILNPLPEIAAAVAGAGRHLLLDAMSSFGALPVDLATQPVAAVLASSNKCLEGVPGIGFALVREEMLAARKGNSPSVSLDLEAQWRGFESNGQWRFTPPVQVVAALVEALRLLEAEGGPEARRARYANNLRVLLAGMRRMGFDLYLDEAVQAPIIATFRSPEGFGFRRFYDALAERGFLIYPGKLTQAESFRIGCIGALGQGDFERLLAAVEEVRASA